MPASGHQLSPKHSLSQFWQWCGPQCPQPFCFVVSWSHHTLAQRLLHPERQERAAPQNSCLTFCLPLPYCPSSFPLLQKGGIPVPNKHLPFCLINKPTNHQTLSQGWAKMHPQLQANVVLIKTQACSLHKHPIKRANLSDLLILLSRSPLLYSPLDFCLLPLLSIL